MDLALLRALNAERAARRTCVLVTDEQGGAARLVREAEVAGDPLQGLLAEGLRSGRSGLVQGPEGESLFLRVQLPSPRLLVIGAVHISQALAPMATAAGFDVTVADPRTAFATPDRFPGVALRAEWPDEVLAHLGGLDRRTALVCLTHEPRIDDPALIAGLASPALYLGALGSRRSHATRVERLRAAGFGDEGIARIHAPVGLAIGAVSPAEIAVSILAELIATLRQGGR